MSALAPTAASAGLSAAEAATRLQRDGPNELPTPRPPSRSKQLTAELTHFFALLLWAAGLLAIVAGMASLGIAIFVVVVVNGLFAFAQETRAEHAAERLRDLLPRRARVLRDGQPLELDASELVVGDIVLLEAGDRISADLVAVEAHALSLDTSLLTGESVPTAMGEGDALPAGTFIVEGAGTAVVTAVGAQTRLAAIASLSQSGQRHRSPLALELDRVVRMVAFIAMGVGAMFFVTAVLIGTPPSDGFLFAIGVTVALVPEGLLPTVTLSLAIGAQRMAERNALIRRLESVETLGSTTFICTDKTGTLTCNEMAVVEVWTRSGVARIAGRGYEPEATVDADPTVLALARRAAIVAARCSTGYARQVDGRWVPEGDPMEAAIDTLTRRVGVDLEADVSNAAVTARYVFDARRRRMSIVAGGQLLVKGASDSVLPRCSQITPGAADAVVDMARRGLRVLAIATRPAPAENEDPDVVERDLELLGLLGFEDPPRPHAASAIASCREAGIRVAMVTGDHPETARAIAAEVGLLGPDQMVLRGDELPSDDAVLGALIDRDGVVISRVTPEDKLRIARVLRGRGHVVAMTGDGVNDGPALREADIGVAMGRSGTDVAREAADLVLLDDDFATIVAAIDQGRATFANTRRFLTYHLTDNVAELTPFLVWALSGGRFPLALGVLQILCLDIGTDLFPALALGAEPARGRLASGPSLGRHLFDRPVLFRVFAVLGPAEALVEMTAFVAALYAVGWRPSEAFPTGHALAAASGAAFAAVVLGQLANAFACRSTVRSPGALGWTSNRMLISAVAVELAALAVFLFVPPVADLLGQAPPPLAAVPIVLFAIPAVLIADALQKRYIARHRTHEPTLPARRDDP